MGIYSDFLLTADFDRTITGPNTEIPQRNLEAIRYFMDNGGVFTVNTGRSVPMFAYHMDKMPVNAPLLLYNGSAAFDKAEGKLSFCHPIQRDMRRTLSEVIEAFPDMTVELQGVDAHYCFTGDKGWAAFNDFNHCANAFASLDQDLGPFLKFSLYGQFRDVTVADLFAGSREEIARVDQVYDLLKQRFGAIMEVFRVADRSIDVHAKGVSKGRAARELQQRLGRKYLVCVGDADNDIPMLEAADYSFCPADGMIAGRFPSVCPCSEGAVADVIYKKIPEIISNLS